MQLELTKLRPALFHKAGVLANFAERRLPGKFGYRLLDRAERALGFSDELTPPYPLRAWVGRYEDPFLYRKVANDVFRDTLCRDLDLKSGERVLDEGCGCGQMAVPLTTYLGAKGVYEGFDADASVVRWCEETITPRFGNFNFKYIDIFSTHYNPTGAIKATEFIFPYADASFDVAFAKSLFTHLQPAECDNYLAQTARVLAPGGRCWISCFLLEPESVALLDAGKSTLDLKYKRDGHRLLNERSPESAVAHDEQAFLGMFQKHGLRPVGSPQRGSWCGRPGPTYQDGIIVTKA